ncbi:dihydroneopterin aldolase [Frigoribacterium faeni]|uniref:dihydroneopterin aldolase n=1 Tax=Frigoribacterium faeni TaxID=145483 RepID=UPI0024132691|nr:dihydroneopterin aldolase [Frigoribacterium faeni]
MTGVESGPDGLPAREPEPVPEHEPESVPEHETVGGPVPVLRATGLDVLRLSGVRATGHHGVFDHERRDGQEFVVDVVVHLDTTPAASGDDLGETVHYGVLAEELVAAVERDPVDLIETLAERLAGVVLAHRAAVSTEVTVHKPGAPITVPFGDVSITISRERA